MYQLNSLITFPMKSSFAGHCLEFSIEMNLDRASLPSPASFSQSLNGNFTLQKFLKKEVESRNLELEDAEACRGEPTMTTR